MLYLYFLDIKHRQPQLHKSRQPPPMVSRVQFIFLNYYDKPHELLHCSNCQLTVKTNHPIPPNVAAQTILGLCEKCCLSSPSLNHRFKNTYLLPQNSRTTLTGVGIINHNLDSLLQAPSHDAPCHMVIICRPISGFKKDADLINSYL